MEINTQENFYHIYSFLPFFFKSTFQTVKLEEIAPTFKCIPLNSIAYELLSCEKGVFLELKLQQILDLSKNLFEKIVDITSLAAILKTVLKNKYWLKNIYEITISYIKHKNMI